MNSFYQVVHKFSNKPILALEELYGSSVCNPAVSLNFKCLCNHEKQFFQSKSKKQVIVDFLFKVLNLCVPSA